MYKYKYLCNVIQLKYALCVTTLKIFVSDTRGRQSQIQAASLPAPQECCQNEPGDFSYQTMLLSPLHLRFDFTAPSHFAEATCFHILKLEQKVTDSHDKVIRWEWEENRHYGNMYTKNNMFIGGVKVVRPSK